MALFDIAAIAPNTPNHFSLIPFFYHKTYHVIIYSIIYMFIMSIIFSTPHHP